MELYGLFVSMVISVSPSAMANPDLGFTLPPNVNRQQPVVLQVDKMVHTFRYQQECNANASVVNINIARNPEILSSIKKSADQPGVSVERLNNVYCAKIEPTIKVLN